MPALLQRRRSSPARARPVQTFDPATHSNRTEYLRPLTEDELRSVLSSPGWARRFPGTNETNPDLAPFRARGIWPYPGQYETIARRDPVVQAELTRHRAYMASLDWRVTPPPEATDEEQEITQYVRDVLWSLPGGFSGLIKRIDRRQQFGFALLELVFEIEESSLRYRLEDCVYLHPSTVHRWLTDESGHLVGILQAGERGTIAIPAEKLAHFARGFTGRNWEGESALRPLHYYVEAKGEALNNYAASAQIFGEGWLDVSTTAEAASPERSEIEDQLDLWGQGEQRWIIRDPDTVITPQHGGSVLPDIEPVVRMYNHQISRGLDGGLQELGTSQFGARAVGSEMRQSTHQALAGEARELASLITSQIVQPLVSLNGWDYTRTPTVTVKGLGAQTRDDADRARVLLEMIRDGVIPPEDIDRVRVRAYELLDVD